MSKFSTVILAAGKGTRMKSDLPKVLHPLGGQPMILFSVALSLKLRSEKTVVVVGKVNESVKAAVSDRFAQASKIEFAIQPEQSGTGHALQCALKAVKLNSESVLVLNADMPLVRSQTIQKLWQTHRQSGAVVSLLTAEKNGAQGFGRVLRDSEGRIERIVEERDATAKEKQIREVNLAIYLFDLKFLCAEIGALGRNNTQREYYLPDLVQRAVKGAHKVLAIKLSPGPDTLGVNSVSELALANEAYYRERRLELQNEGAQLLGDEIFVDASVHVAPGVRLESPCYLKGQTVVGKNVLIESGCVIRDAVIGEGTHFKAHCYVQESKVGKNVQVGPFAHLRPGTVLADDVKIGNFVETKKVRIGKASKVNHLTYLGDASVGKNVNVGAGTITCNYDGVQKFQTVLEDGVFIGSDTQLVAPVTVGKGAYVGAGTTLTKNVRAGSLAISRVPQREIPGWVKRKKKKQSSSSSSS